METSYTYAREHLAELWDKATGDCEPVILKRRGHEDVALISAAELRSMTETLYLLRSPANARWLLEAMRELDEGRGADLTIDEMREHAGLSPA